MSQTFAGATDRERRLTPGISRDDLLGHGVEKPAATISGHRRPFRARTGHVGSDTAETVPIAGVGAAVLPLGAGVVGSGATAVVAILRFRSVTALRGPNRRQDHQGVFRDVLSVCCDVVTGLAASIAPGVAVRGSVRQAPAQSVARSPTVAAAVPAWPRRGIHIPRPSGSRTDAWPHTRSRTPATAKAPLSPIGDDDLTGYEGAVVVGEEANRTHDVGRTPTRLMA